VYGGGECVVASVSAKSEDGRVLLGKRLPEEVVELANLIAPVERGRPVIALHPQVDQAGGGVGEIEPLEWCGKLGDSGERHQSCPGKVSGK